MSNKSNFKKSIETISEKKISLDFVVGFLWFFTLQKWRWPRSAFWSDFDGTDGFSISILGQRFWFCKGEFSGRWYFLLQYYFQWKYLMHVVLSQCCIWYVSYISSYTYKFLLVTNYVLFGYCLRLQVVLKWIPFWKGHHIFMISHTTETPAALIN